MSETQTASLTDFLLARIAEDEADARVVPLMHLPTGHECHDPARVLAVCEALRQIVELHRDGADGLYGPDARFCATCTSTDGLDDPGYPCDTLRALASIYADHPDFRAEWRP